MAVGGGSRKALWYTYADTGMHYEAYYLCLGGYDLTGVCLFVCYQQCIKTTGGSLRTFCQFF